MKKTYKKIAIKIHIYEHIYAMKKSSYKNLRRTTPRSRRSKSMYGALFTPNVSGKKSVVKPIVLAPPAWRQATLI